MMSEAILTHLLKMLKSESAVFSVPLLWVQKVEVVLHDDLHRVYVSHVLSESNFL